MERWLSLRMLGLGGSARTALKLAADHGFSGVELLVRDLVETREPLEDLGRLRDDLGLVGGSWPLPVAWRGERSAYLKDLKRLPTFADAAARIGLDRTGTWVPPECLLEDPERPAAALSPGEVLERLDRIAEILAAYGQRFGLEPLGAWPKGRFQAARAPLGVRGLGPLVERLRARHPNVGLVVDLFHLDAAGETPADGLRWGTAAILAVHLADRRAADSKADSGSDSDRSPPVDEDRTWPGAIGRIPCVEWLRRLRHAGVSGPLFAEPVVGRSDRLGPLEVERVQDAADTLDRLAAEARN